MSVVGEVVFLTNKHAKKIIVPEGLWGVDLKRLWKIKAKIIWWELIHPYLCGPLYKKAHHTKALYIKSLSTAGKISTEKAKEKSRKKFGSENEKRLSLQPDLNESSSEILHRKK